MYSKFWRYFLFFFFVAAFLIAAPAVVLYTAGYRYHFSSGNIVQTGILSLTSIPKGATVFVDQEKQNAHTPSVIDNTIPGTHVIRLEKEGYSTWEKTLMVESRKSTFVSDAVLFLNEKELVDAEILHTPAVDPLSGMIAELKQTPAGLELWIKMPSSSQSNLLLRLSPTEIVQSELSWSPLGRFLLLKTTTNGVLTSRLMDTQSKDQFTLPARSTLMFDVENPVRGFLIHETAVSEVNFLTQEITPFPFPAQAIRTDDNQKIVVQNTSDRSVLSRIDTQGVATILAYLPLSTYQFVLAPDGFILLQDITHNRLLLVEKTDTQEPLLLNTEAIKWDWSTSGQELLFTDGFGIETYKTKTHERETITRLSDPIQDLKWYPLGEIIVYGTATQINALELDRRGQQNKTVLVNGLELTQFWFTEEGSWLNAFLKTNEEFQLLRKRLQK